MSSQLQQVFTQIDRLSSEEKIEVLNYLELLLQDPTLVKETQSVGKSLNENDQSVYDVLAEIEAIGVAKNLPPDLSKNKVYFNEFGC